MAGARGVRMNFRDATEADLPDIDRVFRTSFCETFAGLYSSEDLAAFLAKFSPEAWADEFGDSRYRFRVAEVDGEVVGCVGHDRVGLWALALWPGPVSNRDIGRMDLMDCRELGLRIDRGNGKAPVPFDRLGIVITAEADVEPGAFADRDAATTAEEPVRQLPQADRPDDFNVAQSAFRMMMSSSA